MKKLAFLILFNLFVPAIMLISYGGCFGQDYQRYVIQRNDGSVAIMSCVGGVSVESELERNGYLGCPFRKITDEDLSMITDKKYWKLDNSMKLTIDLEKKQADMDKQSNIDAKKDSVLAKLKISKQELADLNNQ